jgi:hypothetical protein
LDILFSKAEPNPISTSSSLIKPQLRLTTMQQHKHQIIRVEIEAISINSSLIRPIPRLTKMQEHKHQITRLNSLGLGVSPPKAKQSSKTKTKRIMKIRKKGKRMREMNVEIMRKIIGP